MTTPLIINNWQKGIGDSPHLGFGNMKNVDIEGFPGSVRAATSPSSMFPTATSVTFTADAGTDVCTGAFFTGSANVTGTAVTVSSTGTLPAGLSASTNYFIITVSQFSGTFKLATTIANANAGTAINITDAGTGTHTVTTVNPGTVNHIINDPRTAIKFCIDSNGRVWYANGSRYKLLNGNTITNSSGQGLALLRTSDGNATYLFAFRNGNIDVVNVFGTTQQENPSWTNGWQSMNTGLGLSNSHHAINGQDGIIYFCDDRYVGSIQEKAGQVFDPSNSATYTYTNQALDLPIGRVTYWLEELGTNILISVSNSEDPRIYPWDRVSDSFNLPMPIPEPGNKMKNIGNIVYVLAGTKGNIYQTQGTYITLFKKIPEYISNNSATAKSNPITWGGIAAVNGALLVGIGTTTSGNSGAYLVYLDGRLIMEKQLSSGSGRPTAFYASNEFYQMGYASGVDEVVSTRYSNYEPVVESELYRVATKTEKGAYSELELQIGKPVSGTVRIGYRTALTGSYTTLATFTTDTSNTSYKQDIGLIDIENIQVQVEIGQTPDVMEVRLLP